MRRLFPVLAILIGGGLAASLLFGDTESNKDDPKLFANRVWAERIAKDERDPVLYFVPLEAGSKRTGVIERASRYAFSGEIFRWSRDKSTLSLEFPQKRNKAKVTVRTWACANEAPKGFELCLELSDGQAKQRMYSRKDWRVPKGEDLPVTIGDLPDLSDAFVDDCASCAPVPLETVLETSLPR